MMEVDRSNPTNGHKTPQVKRPHKENSEVSGPKKKKRKHKHKQKNSIQGQSKQENNSQQQEPQHQKQGNAVKKKKNDKISQVKNGSIGVTKIPGAGKTPTTTTNYSPNWAMLKAVMNANKKKRKKFKGKKDDLERNTTNKSIKRDEKIHDLENNSKKEGNVKQAHSTHIDQEVTIKPNPAVAIDCEMVGIGPEGRQSMLARVSIVDQQGEVLYDKYVKPQEEVMDYRTNWSGIRPEDLEKGENFITVQKEVADILRGKTLVGHSIGNDLGVLFLSHPQEHIRDTAKYKWFRRLFNNAVPSLKQLSKKVLGITIQEGEHNPIEDAQATMSLYTQHWREGERAKKAAVKNPYRKKKGKL